MDIRLMMVVEMSGSEAQPQPRNCTLDGPLPRYLARNRHIVHQHLLDDSLKAKLGVDVRSGRLNIVLFLAAWPRDG